MLSQTTKVAKILLNLFHSCEVKFWLPKTMAIIDFNRRYSLFLDPCYVKVLTAYCHLKQSFQFFSEGTRNVCMLRKGTMEGMG